MPQVGLESGQMSGADRSASELALARIPGQVEDTIVDLPPDHDSGTEPRNSDTDDQK